LFVVTIQLEQNSKIYKQKINQLIKMETGLELKFEKCEHCGATLPLSVDLGTHYSVCKKAKIAFSKAENQLSQTAYAGNRKNVPMEVIRRQGDGE